MQKLLVFAGILLATHVVLAFMLPKGAAGVPSAKASDVGMVFDLGGRGDQSFNDGAFSDRERAARSARRDRGVMFTRPGRTS